MESNNPTEILIVDDDSESTEIHFERRFETRAEQITQKELQTEAKAVEERIAEMKAVGA